MSWALEETSLHAASVSICFWSGIFGFGCVKNGTRAKKWKRGRGGEGTKHLQTNPGILKTTLASRWGAWLARLVEHNLHVDQRFVSYLDAVTSTLIFCRICFWSARFELWCTSFWNVELFLQLNKGYRLFNFLQSGFLECFVMLGLARWWFLQDVKFFQIVICRSKFWRMDCTLNWS